jgi:hypothetical protein
VSGHYDEAVLYDYLDDPEAFPDRETLEAHLAACGDCRALLDELRSFEEALSTTALWDFADAVRRHREPTGAMRSVADRLAVEDEDAEELRARPSERLFASRQAPTPPPGSEAADESVYGAEAATRARPVEVARAEPPRPATRIGGLPGTVETPSGPRLDWQQGPASVVPAGSSGLAGLAFAPMPPRRPDEVVVTGALPAAPLPPTRPGALALLHPLPGPPEPPEDAAETLPRSVEHPLPPPRPGAPPTVVAAGVPPAPQPQPAPVAKAAPQVQPALAAKAAPQPVLTAAAKARPAEAEPAAPGARAAPARDDRVRLSALLADAAGDAPRGAEPRAPNAAPSGGPVLAMGFSSSPMGDLTTSRFTGPAVKPLLTR